jgi:hypothetical protein
VLCAARNETVARYTLQGTDRPTGVCAYAVGRAASKAPLPGLGVGVASDDLRDALRELRR